MSAYETIMTDRDTGQSMDTYESYYLAYGLFKIFMKWAKGGYAENDLQRLREIETHIIILYNVYT